MNRSQNIPSVYRHDEVEDRIYGFWLENGFFHADPSSPKPAFCIVIPPPNITGSLHMGHALDNTLQDVLARWKRMSGFETLWLPGTDHASIATHIKIEELLREEGLTRYEIGREKFLERAWKWKEKYGSTIINQLKKLGASCDWSRERFTMDEGCSRAVTTVFCRLYEKGLIYRGDYITNWCPTCGTVISDIEVEHEDEEGNLYYVRYGLQDGTGYVTVATTRPETMLGDTAVAVHPSDRRYAGLIGKNLVLPLVNRVIPIIADEYVDPEFGTGAVKVTPAHDPNDFEMGMRHALPLIKVIDEEGKMRPEAGRYAGLGRYECRKAVVEDLKSLGLLEKVEPHHHSVGHCYRCGTVVEPLVTKQWFVRMKPLAQPALEAVKNGTIRFVPERFTKTYVNWMENIRDWCISRQLWWGHRIPAWYCQECGKTMVSDLEVTECDNCGSKNIQQDPDVLDTWFSSGLWPFSTLGWPDDTPELRRFYPTSVLVTGYDIIFFWVARMIVFGLEFMGKEPFRDVLIHGLVRDAEGRKMSKTLGNGIDPLDVIQAYGADTLRFTVITGNAPGNDMRFHWEKVEGSRNFCNKVWNAARYVLMNIGEDIGPGMEMPHDVQPEDQWILSRLKRVAENVTQNLSAYELGEAARELYEFFWGEYCDWYIEMAKTRINSGRNASAAKYTLWFVLENYLRLLHPFMPFITEEIWQALPHEGKSIMIAPWPQTDGWKYYEEAENNVTTAIAVIKAIRNLRAELSVPPGKKIKIEIHVTPELKVVVSGLQEIITSLSGTAQLDICDVHHPKPRKAIAAVIPGAEIYMPVEGLVDIDREVQRLERELDEASTELRRSQCRLGNEEFLRKAPEDIVEKERRKADDLRDKINRLRSRLDVLKG